MILLRNALIVTLGLMLSMLAPNPSGAKPNNRFHAGSMEVKADDAGKPYVAWSKLSDDKCYFSKDHEVADLCAQWRAAKAAEISSLQATKANNWAAIAAVASMATIVGLLVSLRQTGEALQEARKSSESAERQVGISERALDAQLRAYVGIAASNYHFVTHEADGGSVAVTCEVKNFGATPAYGFICRSRLDLVPFPLHPKSFPIFSPWQEDPHTLSPTMQISQTVTASYSASQIAQFRAKGVCFLVTVEYRFMDHVDMPRGEVTRMAMFSDQRWDGSHGANPTFVGGEILS